MESPLPVVDSCYLRPRIVIQSRFDVGCIPLLIGFAAVPSLLESPLHPVQKSRIGFLFEP